MRASSSLYGRPIKFFVVVVVVVAVVGIDFVVDVSF